LKDEIPAYAGIMAQHNELGKEGEQLAIDFLIKNGYSIRERNYRFNKAEVDIIASKKDVLAIVEVKTRSTNVFGNPEDFVKPKQIQNLVKVVNEYVIENDLDVEVRFDIIAITKSNVGFDIEHLENAFYHF
jgi:putative endonuclease